MSVAKHFADRTAAAPEVFSARVLSGMSDPFLEVAEAAGANVFQSRPFLEQFERHMLAGSRKLVLVGVTDAAGKPIAVFPFVRLKKFGVTRLEAVDFDVTDYFAPAYFRDAALSADDTAKLWRTVARSVPGVHAIAFKKLPRQLHHKPHALSGADFLKPMAASATTLYLRDASGKPTQNMNPAALARKLKKSAKVLQKHGPLTFTEATSKQDTDELLEALLAFRTARFQELGRQDALLDPNVVAFYRALACKEGKASVGRVFALRSADEIVAVTYGYAYRKTFTLIAPAITPKKEYQPGSPGLVAMFKTLEWCQQHDFDVFDLSVGSLSYKSRFEAETVELYEYQQALSPLGLIVVAEAALRRRIRRLALKYPELRSTLEKLRRMRWGWAGDKPADA
ncbi:GNAT family N-acetyltransferase [Mesorhizobium sp. KR9-304]|uniref:GNAT family N-acetyltransferase n=1 Tax=Mesorhizobium sp. KR9-304 TaxID=3156614 RepID=UPI0032B4FA94